MLNSVIYCYYFSLHQRLYRAVTQIKSREEDIKRKHQSVKEQADSIKRGEFLITYWPLGDVVVILIAVKSLM